MILKISNFLPQFLENRNFDPSLSGGMFSCRFWDCLGNQGVNKMSRIGFQSGGEVPILQVRLLGDKHSGWWRLWHWRMGWWGWVTDQKNFCQKNEAHFKDNFKGKVPLKIPIENSKRNRQADILDAICLISPLFLHQNWVNLKNSDLFGDDKLWDYNFK